RAVLHRSARRAVPHDQRGGREGVPAQGVLTEETAMRVLTWSLLGVLVLPLTATAQSPQEKQATVAYIQGLQQPDGGFLAQRPDPRSAAPAAPQSGLRPTLTAVRGLKYFGAEPRDPAAAARFVRSCFNPEFGWFADRPGGKPDVTVTAIG